jgi:hypothetical protein
MESQTAVFGTTLSASGYRCMVPAMSGPLHSTRACVVALLALVLVLGVSGFLGAIHSAHHLPGPAESHQHDAPDKSCPVAAAALHLSATMVEEAPTPGALSPVARLVLPGTPDCPRSDRREPASGRAPPSLRSLSS